MKRPPLIVFLAIPIAILLLIWVLTFAFGLMREADDLSVVIGVVILFFALLAIAYILNYFKTKL